VNKISFINKRKDEFEPVQEDKKPKLLGKELQVMSAVDIVQKLWGTKHPEGRELTE